MSRGNLITTRAKSTLGTGRLKRFQLKSFVAPQIPRHGERAADEHRLRIGVYLRDLRQTQAFSVESVRLSIYYARR